MFTLGRVSVLGLGVGLVLAACASPTDETSDESTDDGLAPTTEAAPSEGTAASDVAAQPASTEEGAVGSKSDAIIVGAPGFGWGGAGFVGVPVGGFYGGWGVPGMWGGGLGWGRGFGWGGTGLGLGWGRGFGWGGWW